VSADLVKRQAELKKINADLAGLQTKPPASPDVELTQEAEEQLLADVDALDLTQEAMDVSAEVASAASTTPEKVSFLWKLIFIWIEQPRPCWLVRKGIGQTR
jgi:hypothetical protein